MPPIKQEQGRTKLSNMILITIGANAVKTEEPSGLLASTATITTTTSSGRLLIKIRNKAQSFFCKPCLIALPKLQYYYIIDAMLHTAKNSASNHIFFPDHKYE